MEVVLITRSTTNDLIRNQYSTEAYDYPANIKEVSILISTTFPDLLMLCSPLVIFPEPSARRSSSLHPQPPQLRPRPPSQHPHPQSPNPRRSPMQLHAPVSLVATSYSNNTPELERILLLPHWRSTLWLASVLVKLVLHKMRKSRADSWQVGAQL